MAAADTNLQNLHDIIVPSPVPAWPPAPGWYVVAATVLVVIALLAAWVWRRHQRRAYRRAALAELQRIETSESSQSVMAITELLKRTALVAYPRSAVAGLSGNDWWTFLDAHCSGSQFSEQLGAVVDASCFQSRQAGKTEVDALRRATERWINNHQAAATPVMV